MKASPKGQTSATLIFLGLALPFLVLATTTITIENPIQADTFEELVDGIIGFIFLVALGLAPLMIIIGAFYILTAGADPKRVETGKNIILYTLIGFTIILLGRALVFVIQQILG